MNIEEDLKRVLGRQDPPDGFTERVLERLGRDEPRPRVPWRLAAASVALVAVIGGYAAHEAIERRRGEEAREQVLVALGIAGAKIRYAQQQVHDIGSR